MTSIHDHLTEDQLKEIEGYLDSDDGRDGQWVDPDCQGMCLTPEHVRALITEVRLCREWKK